MPNAPSPTRSGEPLASPAWVLDFMYCMADLLEWTSALAQRWRHESRPGPGWRSGSPDLAHKCWRQAPPSPPVLSAVIPLASPVFAPVIPRPGPQNPRNSRPGLRWCHRGIPRPLARVML
jgi:hypothetical protein